MDKKVPAYHPFPGLYRVCPDADTYKLACLEIGGTQDDTQRRRDGSRIGLAGDPKPLYYTHPARTVLAWLEQQGGVEGMQRLKRARAAKVYDFLDNSALFHACAQPGSRSDMNVTFRTGDDALDKEFISGAAARGLLNLKGHRVAGGMRASLYNAMPMAGVDALVDYLKQFEVEHHV